MPKVVCAALNIETGPHLEILPKAGFEVAFPQKGLNLFQEDQLIEALKGASATIAGSEPYTRKVFEALPELRVVVRRGVGYDAVDTQAAADHNVVVATTPGVLDESVAEHTIAMLMGCARGFPALDRYVRRGTWIRTAYPRMSGKTLGIVGLGRIGQAVARKAIGLGMKVVAFDPYPNEEFASKWGIEYLDLDTLLGRSDVVSLHLAMSNAAKHMINRETLAKMKRGSILVNTGRGPLVNENHLVEALRSGHLLAAGLDVFEQEPLPLTSPLLDLENVLLSGHMAGVDIESNSEICVKCADIIVELHRGGWPQECIRNFSSKGSWKW